MNTPDPVALHEAAHVFAAFGAGGRVSSVKLHEGGGTTVVRGLTQRNHVMVRLAGRVAERVFGHELADAASGEDNGHAHLTAALIVGALERAADSRRAAPRAARSTSEMFAALDRDPDAVVEVVARHPRARRLIALAEQRAEEVVLAHRTAIEHFARVLTARGSLDEDAVLSVLGEALDLQDKEEPSCSNS